MAARVVWIASRRKWYLVDRHPKHPNGRRTWALGPGEADRERGGQAAEAINAARHAGQAAKDELEGGGAARGATLLTAWWAAARPGLADTTQVTVEGHLRLHLIPQLGELDLRRLSREQVKAFAGGRADAGLGQHAIAGALSVLRRALRWGVEQGFLEREPVPRLMRVGNEAAAARGARKGGRDAFTRDEARVLLDLAKPGSALFSIVLAACQTGARKGELLSLRWCAVDFSRGRIEWSGSRSRTREKATKANKVRYTELSDELRRELLAVQRRRPSDRRFRDQAEEHVFLDRRHQPWKYDSLSSAWRRIQARAVGRGVRPLAFHCWRHTFVSWAFEAGVNPLWIAEQIGDRPETMMRTYAHVVRGDRPSLAFLSVQRDAQPVTMRTKPIT